jgi:hypothetical protein
MSRSHEGQFANIIGPMDGYLATDDIGASSTSYALSAIQRVADGSRFVTLCGTVAFNGFFSTGAGTAVVATHPPFAAGVHYRMRVPDGATHFNHIGSTGKLHIWESSGS